MHHQLYALIIAIIIYLSALGMGCGNAKHDGAGPTQADPAILTGNAQEQLAALAAPPGVDPAVLALLKQELLRQLGTQFASRTASQVAATEENRVTTLSQSRSGGQVTLTWVEKGIGDYNQDGQVAVDDLVPVGQYWMLKEGDANWPNAAIADGDKNGIVNVADVTPIGRNFGNRILAYSVYTGATADYSACTWIASAGHDTALRIGIERHYSVTLNEADTGACFFVAPSDGTDDGIESLPSSIWGSPNWVHLASFNPYDVSMDIVYDAARQVYYTAGYTDNPTTASPDFCLAKYDARGNLLWARAWGTIGIEYSYGVAVDEGGNIYQTGNSNGIGSGLSQCVLVKWDADGNELWARCWGGTGADTADGFGVAVSAGGMVYVNAHLGHAAGDSMALLEYSPDGALTKAVTWRTGSIDFAEGIAIDASGIYCAGRTILGATPLHYVPVVVHYDFNLARQWGKIYDMTEVCYGEVLALDASHIYLGGNTGGFGSLEADAVVLCLDKSGIEQWNIATGGADCEWVSGIAVDPAGNVFASGLTASLNPPVYSAMLEKFDAAGVWKWTALWDGPTGAQFTGLVFDNAGMLVLAGSASSLNNNWQNVGMPSWQLTFTPTDITGPDIPLTGVETDATALGLNEMLVGVVDTGSVPTESDFAIASYKPF